MKYLNKQETLDVLGVFPSVLERHIKLGDITPIHCVSAGNLFKYQEIINLRAKLHPESFILTDVPKINNT